MKFPSPEQIRELPLDLRMTVPPEWEDRNGHVNVQYYLKLYELGGWNVLERSGFDEPWFRKNRVGFFDSENHLSYRAEIRIGDSVSAYNRLLGRSAKRFHGLYLIVNDTRNRLAAVLEYVTVMVDMRTRRSTVLPGELAGGLDALLEGHRALNWPAPACGFMGPGDPP